MSETSAELNEAPARLPAPEDEEGLPVVEAGLSVAPEDLGRQFLKDATEQDNFESDMDPEHEGAEATLAEVTGEAALASRDDTLDTSEDAMPRLGTERLPPEQASPSELDLHSSSIREGSLFDQPTEQGTRSPRVEADEGGEEDEPKGPRETARAQALARLRRLTRPRALRGSRVGSRPHPQR